MLASILSAIAAIPKLLEAIQQLLGYFKKAEEERWFTDKVEAFQKIKEAQTDEEYIQAAKALSDLLRKS